MKRMKSIMMMDNMNNNMMEATEFVVPESLFESLDQLDYGYDSGACAEDSLLSELMDTDLMTSDTMATFLEMESVKEVEPAKIVAPRPSVIIKNTIKTKKAEPSLSLSEILTSCGIEYDLVESEQSSPAASPSSSLGSDMEKTQDLIDELEDFFMKTEGSPTEVKEESLKLEDLDNAMTTSLVTDDGQKVVIILAPSSPTDSLVSGGSSLLHDSGLDDTDPEWSPSPASPQDPAKASKPRKKYERTKKPKAPSTAPYPTDKKERKKAQNRTAAYRYREKMKEAENQVEEELEALEEKNTSLKEQFAEMQNEFKYLKKLMTEAGLGHYAAAVNF